MSAPLVSQLNIVDGAAQEEGPYTYAWALPGEGEPEYLFLLLEPAGRNAPEVCRNAADLFLQRFTADRRSVTGRLSEALKTVHEGLRWENQHSLQQDRTSLGVACAFLRGDDLYLAHAGLTLAYVVGPEACRRLAPAPGGPAPGLGSGREAAVWVRHHRLQPGERLLLACSPLAVGPGEGESIEALRRRLDEGMVEVYRRSRGAPSFAALAVEPRLDGEADEDQALAAGAGRHAAAAGGLAGQGEPEPYGYVRRQAAGDAAPPAPPSQGLDPTGLTLAVGLRPPPSWVRGTLGRLLAPRVLAGLAGLVLLAGALWGFQAMTEGRARAAAGQAAASLAAAEELETRAASADSGDARRRLLREALAAAAAAAKHPGTRPEAAGLEARLSSTLSLLDAVFPLTGLRPLADLGAGGGSTLVREMVRRGSAIYLLDKTGDRVLQLTWPDAGNDGSGLAPAVLVPPQARTRRNLTGFVWLPRGGNWRQDSLLVLDESRKLYEVRPGGELQQLTLRGAGDWASFQAAAGFGGNLYVLDPKASEVWRYVSTDSGFDSERLSALPSVALQDAVDLVVDGDIYVLLRTGSMLRFSGGRPQPFSLDGLDRPLLNPTAFYVGASAVYVADQGNKRVVVLDKTGGRFLRQHPVPDLAQIHDIFADEERGELFLLDGRRLYIASIPTG